MHARADPANRRLLGPGSTVSVAHDLGAQPLAFVLHGVLAWAGGAHSVASVLDITERMWRGRQWLLSQARYLLEVLFPPVTPSS